MNNTVGICGTKYNIIFRAADNDVKLYDCDEEIVKLIECALADVDAHSYSFTENSEYYLGLTIKQLKWLREKLTKQSSV